MSTPTYLAKTEQFKKDFPNVYESIDNLPVDGDTKHAIKLVIFLWGGHSIYRFSENHAAIVNIGMLMINICKKGFTLGIYNNNIHDNIDIENIRPYKVSNHDGKITGVYFDFEDFNDISFDIIDIKTNEKIEHNYKPEDIFPIMNVDDHKRVFFEHFLLSSSIELMHKHANDYTFE